ncbi:DNA mismatch repair protein MutS [Spraguea lophii 42_110]|uniref:DNA mismatch repair protein MutS n=1 Tax=Spraguea lophii (strain 42_110) TaxID=1358809 RepID=S7W8Z5_SPRLO|nr:DNA mismatch repair protein MutS [Spraguea lophii 42_110]
MKNPIYPSYVSNDININNTIILTGANMGGKSTLLRSICYNVILNQMGLGISIEDNNNDNRYYNDNNNICKVIDYEEYINNNINTINNNINTESNINNITNTMNNNYMSIFDKIYTRIGASDNLLEGISTFQNEMKECSTILNGITNRSLIIMDELGRGTSTVDGSAIAMSVINYISNTHSSRYNGNKIIRRPLLLFSTHYNNIIYKLLNNHNNTDSNDNTTTNNTINHTNHNNHTNTHINNIKPMYMKTLLNNNDIIFCYKLVDGVADSSLGIKVARLAGVDSKIIDRAEEILKQL